MNARDLMSRGDGIIFEGEAARSWIEQLAKRAKATLDAAKGNKIIEKEWKGEREELIKALKALNTAVEHLDVFASAVARREDGQSNHVE